MRPQHRRHLAKTRRPAKTKQTSPSDSLARAQQMQGELELAQMRLEAERIMIQDQLLATRLEQALALQQARNLDEDEGVGASANTTYIEF